MGYSSKQQHYLPSGEIQNLFPKSTSYTVLSITAILPELYYIPPSPVMKSDSDEMIQIFPHDFNNTK